jgi:hypothetical protein
MPSMPSVEPESRFGSDGFCTNSQPPSAEIMSTDPFDRAEVAADLENARIEFHRLLGVAGPNDWGRPTLGTRWSNEQLLFHMVFGYMTAQRLLLILVKVFDRLPDEVSRGFARLLNAATKPFDVINYYGSSAAALVYNRRRMGAKMDHVIAALQRKLAQESDDAAQRGMHFPTRWDPFSRTT